jgi:hypothetical protein
MRHHAGEESVTIYYAENLAEADVVKARLEKSGIAAFVAPSRIPVSEDNQDLASSVRVLVAAQQAEAARRLLQKDADADPRE